MIEAYKNNKLVYGGYKKLPDRQNLLEYWLVFRGNNKKMSAAYLSTGRRGTWREHYDKEMSV